MIGHCDQNHHNPASSRTKHPPPHDQKACAPDHEPAPVPPPSLHQAAANGRSNGRFERPLGCGSTVSGSDLLRGSRRLEFCIRADGTPWSEQFCPCLAESRCAFCSPVPERPAPCSPRVGLHMLLDHSSRWFSVRWLYDLTCVYSTLHTPCNMLYSSEQCTGFL